MISLIILLSNVFRSYLTRLFFYPFLRDDNTYWSWQFRGLTVSMLSLIRN